MKTNYCKYKDSCKLCMGCIEEDFFLQCKTFVYFTKANKKIKEVDNMDKKDISIEILNESVWDLMLVQLTRIADTLENLAEFPDVKAAVEVNKQEDTRPSVDKTSIKSTSEKIFDYFIKSETEKALLVCSNTTNKVAWLPRKAVKFMNDDYIHLHDWFKGKVQWKEDTVF